MKKDWNYTLVYNHGVIQKEPSEEVQSFIKLLSEVLELEFYPKETVVEPSGYVRTKILSRKISVPKSQIEYLPDTIHRQLCEIGLRIPFGWVLDYGMIEPQRERENKYLMLDIIK